MELQFSQVERRRHSGDADDARRKRVDAPARGCARHHVALDFSGQIVEILRRERLPRHESARLCRQVA